MRTVRLKSNMVLSYGTWEQDRADKGRKGKWVYREVESQALPLTFWLDCGGVLASSEGRYTPLSAPKATGIMLELRRSRLSARSSEGP